VKIAADASFEDVQDARRKGISLCEKYFRKKPDRLISRGGGLNNFIFFAGYGEHEFVIRMSPSAEGFERYLKERWAISRAREAGVPAPRILEVGNTLIPSPYMILERVKGRVATSHRNRLRILGEMGRYTRVINSLKTSGFGWGSGKWTSGRTWLEFLHEDFQLDTRLEILRLLNMIPALKIEKIRTILRNLNHLNPRSFLNHGDMRLKNVVVSSAGKISAIIDWENSVSSIAPAWDLSLALHDLSIDEKQAFIEGYGISRKKMADIAPVVKALNIVHYSTEIERLRKEDDRRTLEHYRMRLSGNLDSYCF